MRKAKQRLQLAMNASAFPFLLFSILSLSSLSLVVFSSVCFVTRSIRTKEIIDVARLPKILFSVICCPNGASSVGCSERSSQTLDRRSLLDFL